MSVLIKDLKAGYDEQIILKNINIEVKKGCVCALLGKNGSGKSTLFKCIGGLLKPMSGEIIINNVPISRLKRHEIAKLISFVPQKTNSVFSYSVVEMVLMGETSKIKAWGKPNKRAYEKAYETCEEMGIAYLADKKYNQLSGGEQQLVLIARAIMQDTPIMLLDEPTSHLDFCNQHKVMKLLKELVERKNITIIITLHDPNLASCYSDEVIMINNGNVIAAGHMQKLFNDNNLRLLFGDIVKTDFTTQGLKIAVPSSI